MKSSLPDQPSTSNGGRIVIGSSRSTFLAQALTHLDRAPTALVWIGPDLPTRDSPLSVLLRGKTCRHIFGLPGQGKGQGELVRYNLPEFVSLTEPLPSIFALFPGLRETGRESFDWVDVTMVTSALADVPDPLTIWVELPGAEVMILDALADASLWTRIQHLHLRCCAEPFFDGAGGQAAIASKLLELGFVLDAIDDSDPDFPALHFHADQQQRRIHTLELALIKAQCDAAEHKTAVEQALALLETARKDAEQRAELSQRDLHAVRQIVADREETVARLTVEISQARIGLNRALQTVSLQQSDLSDLQRRHKLLIEERDRLERLMEALTPRLREAAEHLRALSIVNDKAIPEAAEIKPATGTVKRRKRKS